MGKIPDTFLMFDLPEGVKIYKRPKLPLYEFKANKVKYKIPDLRLLDKIAVNYLFNVINTAAQYQGSDSASFDVSELSEDEIRIIIDIVDGFDVEAIKGGRNGYSYNSSFITCGARIETVGKKKTLTFNLVKDHAKAIYEFAQENRNINLCELIVFVVEKCEKEFMEAFKIQLKHAGDEDDRNQNHDRNAKNL